MNVSQPFFAVLDTDPSGPDPMPDLESHSGQRLDCQNLFIDVDAPLVDDQGRPRPVCDDGVGWAGEALDQAGGAAQINPMRDDGLRAA
jgi:hypothetical protein